MDIIAMVVTLNLIFFAYLVGRWQGRHSHPISVKRVDTRDSLGSYVRYHTRMFRIIETLWKRTHLFQKYGSAIKTPAIRQNRFDTNYAEMFQEVCCLMNLSREEGETILRFDGATPWKVKQRINHMLMALGIFHVAPKQKIRVDMPNLEG